MLCSRRLCSGMTPTSQAQYRHSWEQRSSHDYGTFERLFSSTGPGKLQYSYKLNHDLHSSRMHRSVCLSLPIEFVHIHSQEQHVLVTPPTSASSPRPLTQASEGGYPIISPRCMCRWQQSLLNIIMFSSSES